MTFLASNHRLTPGLRAAVGGGPMPGLYCKERKEERVSLMIFFIDLKISLVISLICTLDFTYVHNYFSHSISAFSSLKASFYFDVFLLLCDPMWLMRILAEA